MLARLDLRARGERGPAGPDGGRASPAVTETVQVVPIALNERVVQPADHPTGTGEVWVVACGAGRVVLPTTITRCVVPFLPLTTRVVAGRLDERAGRRWRVQARPRRSRASPRR